MNITIQAAVAGDADSLAKIQKEAFERLYLIYQDEKNPYLRGSNEIKYQIENGTRDLYKILVDDTLCGGIAVWKKGNGEYYLYRIYISPKLQRKGIARKAIELCEMNYPNAKRWTVDFPADQIANRLCYEYCGYYYTGVNEVLSDKLTLAFYEKAINGIFEIRQTQLESASEVIKISFAAVAKEFNLTEQNCPKHTAFITTPKRLQNHFDGGWLMYGLHKDKRLVGYASLSKENDGVFELHNFAVLPEYRHLGNGRELLNFCKEKVKELNGKKIVLGIIEENTVLKNWYIENGFTHTGTKNFPHLPFTVGYMEWEG